MSRSTIARYLPIAGWLPDCSPRTIRADTIAGIALAGLLVPEGMAYAGIAGVPPQMGLYAAMAGMFVYAIFGTSRQLAVTATSSSAAMLAALVAPLAAGDAARYAALACSAAIAAGFIFLLGGVLKLGAVSEFISKPVLKGFVFGLALTIMVKQAHKLTGISSGQGNFFQLAWHAITSLKEVNLWTCAVGATALVVMFLLGAFAPRVPSALVVLVLGVLSVSLFGLKKHEVGVVGTIHAGMPSVTLPRIGEDDLADIFVGAIGIVLVLTAEGLAAGRTFAAKHKVEISPNQELCAMGAANIASGLLGGIIVGGGMSGTAANDSAGARSQLSTIASSICVALTLAYLLPLIQNLPEAVLGAIVVHAVAHLVDVKTLRYYARLRAGGVWGAIIALAGVLLMGILKGLIFAVGITLAVLMRRLSAPQDSVLGRLPGLENFADVRRHPEAEQVPGLLIFRPNGVLFFANSNRIRSHLMDLITTSSRPLRAVLINLEASSEIDVTSLEMLQQLHGDLQQSGIALYFARVADRVSDLFERSQFSGRLGAGRLFPGVDLAVAAFLRQNAALGETPEDKIVGAHVHNPQR
jgi:SulP family sulfate permease